MPSPEPGAHLVVIGLGNPLMGDDGLGLAALERLRERAPTAEVELVDGGTWGLSLLPIVESASHLLLLDAIDGDRPPGTVIELTGGEVPRYFEVKFSPHEVDLRDVLALAELRGALPREIVALGIQPARVEMRTDLSDAVLGALEPLLDRACARLADWTGAAALAVGGSGA
jgi:hydrogenase maturation protease